MLDAADLQAIAALLQPQFDKIDSRFEQIDSRFEQIDSRLDKIESRLETLEEDTKETRVAVNSLVEWVERVSEIVQVPYPVDMK